MHTCVSVFLSLFYLFFPLPFLLFLTFPLAHYNAIAYILLMTGLDTFPSVTGMFLPDKHGSGNGKHRRNILVLIM